MSILPKAVQDKVVSFYKQSPAEQQATLQLVLREATAQPAAFIAMLQQEKFDGLNNLPVFYEALALDIDNWADFFLAEARRLLHLAKASTAPQSVLTHFTEFTFIKPEKFRHRRALLQLLASELENPNSVFRFYLMDNVEALATASDQTALRQLAALTNDKNWRVRYKLYLVAKDSLVINGIAKFNWLDRLKAALFNPFDIT